MGGMAVRTAIWLGLATVSGYSAAAQSVALDPETVTSLRAALDAYTGVSLQRVTVQPATNEQTATLTIIGAPASIASQAAASPLVSSVASQLTQPTAVSIWNARCNPPSSEHAPLLLLKEDSVSESVAVAPPKSADPYCNNEPNSGSPFAEVDTTYGVWQGFAALRTARMNFVAEDISVAADGTVWFLDASSSAKDKPIKKVTGNGITSCGSAAGSRIAAGLKDTVFVLNTSAQLWMGTCNPSGSNWTHLSEGVLAVGVSSSGQIWGLGKGGIPMSFDLATKQWKQLSGEGVDIGVGIDGRPWVVNADNAIWNLDEDWKNIPGAATQVKFDADGIAYIVGPNKQVYRSKTTAFARDTRQTWFPIPGVTGWRVAVSPAGSIYAINQSTKQVTKFDLSAP